MRATEYAGAGPTTDGLAADGLRADGLTLHQRALIDLASGRFEAWVDPAQPLPAVRVRALVDSGEHRAARRELASITAAEMACWSPRDLVSAALAVSRVGPRERCEELLELVERAEGPLLSDNQQEVVPTAFVQALCLMALGHHDEAQHRFDEALVAAESIGPIVGAQVRAELGRFHLGLGPARARSARAHLMAAAVCLRASRLDGLADRATELLEGEGPVGVAGPDRGLFEPGSQWQVGFGITAPVMLDGDAGMHAIRYALARPDCDLCPVEVARHVAAHSASFHPHRDDTLDQARVAVTDAIGRSLEHLDGLVPDLARHLRGSMTEGSAIRYKSAPAVKWSLGVDR